MSQQAAQGVSKSVENSTVQFFQRIAETTMSLAQTSCCSRICWVSLPATKRSISMFRYYSHCGEIFPAVKFQISYVQWEECHQSCKWAYITISGQLFLSMRVFFPNFSVLSLCQQKIQFWAEFEPQSFWDWGFCIFFREHFCTSARSH